MSIICASKRTSNVAYYVLFSNCDELDHQNKDESNEITNGNFNPGTMLWRALNCLMACFFAMAAYVQVNE